MKEFSLKNYAGTTAKPFGQRRTFSSLMSLFVIAGFFSAVIAANGVGNRAYAQAEMSPADVVPADSVLYMDVELDQTSEQWTTFYELLDRAGLSDLAEQEANVSPEQAGQLAAILEFTGQAALVFTSPEAFSSEALTDFGSEAADMTADPAAVAGGEVPPGFAVVFQPENPQALYDQLKNMIGGEDEGAAPTVETTEYNGTTIETITGTDDDATPAAIALVEDTIVLAASPADIEPIVDTINGELEPLSSNEHFMEVRSSLEGPSLSFGYANGAVIVEQLATEEPAAADFTNSLAGYFGWNAFVDQSGFRLDTVAIPAEDAEFGMVTAFDPTFAEKVSAETLYFLNGNNLAGSGIFDLFGFALQASLAGTGTDILATPVSTPTVDDVYAQLESQLGFNLKTDLFDQLDGEFALAVDVDQIFSQEPVTDAVFVSDVADETSVTDVASKITYILNATLEEGATLSEREVTGGTVTSITIDEASTGGFPVVLEYGVVDGQLLIGVNHGIDNYLGGSTETLAQDPNFQQTMNALPQENVVGIQYLNLAKLLPMIEEAAMGVSASTSVLDNDLACGEYGTQEEAQAAYDADSIGLWNLDLDYDGMACEDFFSAAASPVASPATVSENLNLVSLGTVSYTEGDTYKTSTILLVGE